MKPNQQQASNDEYSALYNLRQQAEAQLQSVAPDRLLHELQVHQIELELQNEELRRTHELLVAAHAQFVDLFDLAPVGYLLINQQGLIEKSNITAAHMLGYEPAHLAMQAISRYIVRDYQDTFYLLRKRLFASGQIQSCELQFIKQGAEPFWAQLVVSCVETSDAPATIRLALLDISERKKIDIELADSLLGNSSD